MPGVTRSTIVMLGSSPINDRLHEYAPHNVIRHALQNEAGGYGCAERDRDRCLLLVGGMRRRRRIEQRQFVVEFGDPAGVFNNLERRIDAIWDTSVQRRCRERLLIPADRDPKHRSGDVFDHRKPGWATFDPSTGALTGTPTTTDEGISGAITITASDGGTTASIGPFTIDVTATPPPELGPQHLLGQFRQRTQTVLHSMTWRAT